MLPPSWLATVRWQSGKGCPGARRECNPGSAAAKRKQDRDKKGNDVRGLLAKQLARLAPGQTYDTDGNVSAGGVQASKLGKGALKKAIIGLGETPCV